MKFVSDYFCLETKVAFCSREYWALFHGWNEMISCRTIFVSKRKLLLSREYWALFHGSENDMKWFLRGNWARFHKKNHWITDQICFGRSEETSIRPKMKSLTLRVFASLIDFALLLLLNYFLRKMALIWSNGRSFAQLLFFLLLITGCSTLKSVTFAWLLFKGKIVVSICDNLLAS